MRQRVPFFVTAAACVAFATPALAADYTDLVDAADDKDDLIDETYDGFDFNIEPSFQMDFTSATITREAACVPRQSDLVGDASENFEASNPRLEVNPERCSEPVVVDNNEADYRRQTMTLNLALKAGLYKDLQLHLNVPYVIQDTHGMKYADGVSASNSSIDPSDDRIRNDAERAFQGNANTIDRLDFFSTYRYFDLSDQYQDIARGGFGDPSLGLHWAPFNDERDPTKATLAIGMDWVMPLSPVRMADNDAVGGGLHELTWSIKSSKRFDFIEPYFGLEYKLPLPAPRSPIGSIDQVNNDGQVFFMPPQKGEITIGTEFIPHEDPETGARYGIDLQFRFGYTSEGRDYTPLFEHMTDSSCHGKSLQEVLPQFDADGNITSLGDVECAWVAQQPSNGPLFGGNPDPVYDLNAVSDQNIEFENFDGIMTVESYGSWAGRVGLLLQPSQYFAFKAHVQLEHQQEHFLTNARTGRDIDDINESDPDDTVDLEGPDAELEKNPVFNPTYDGNGQRFRVQEHNTWSVFLTAALKF